MLIPSQVIPFFEHDDWIVREFAVRYFRECSDPDPLTADDYWRAIDKFPEPDDAEEFTSRLDAVPETERSLQQLMNAIAAPAPEKLLHDYLDAMRTVSLPLLAAHRDELLALPNLTDEVRGVLRRRLELLDVPSAELWTRLMEEGLRLGGANVGEFDPVESDILIDALGNCADMAMAPLAMAVLDDFEAEDTWQEIFATQILGALRFEPAISRMIEFYATDGDLLIEKTTEALGNIGTNEVIDEVLAFCKGQAFSLQICPSAVFERIKRPESESALMSLIENTTEDDDAAFFLQELANLGSLAGLDRARKIMSEGTDPERQYMSEQLLAIATITGVDLPEAAAWRAEADKAHARKPRDKAEILAKFEEYMAGHKSGAGKFDDGYEDDDEEDLSRLPTMAELSDRDEVIAPIHRAAPKVGRNDPCPCGSGKKYKKCCLNK